jgi:hypothetical protein
LFNVADWWHEDYEEHFDFWGNYTFEEQTNDDDEVGFDPYPVYNLSSMAYYGDSPSKNFSRAFFGVDYLNPHDNRDLDRIKWHMNRLDFVKYKVRYMYKRYMLFLDQLVGDMDSEDPLENMPKHDMYKRARFLRRHRLNVLKNVWNRTGSEFKRQIFKHRMPNYDRFYRKKILNSRIEFLNPLNPKKLYFSYDKPFPPVAILEKDRAFKIYDLEWAIKDGFNQITYGDFDWRYLTKFYEINDWNFQVVRPQNTFFFFFDDFELENKLHIYQDEDGYLSELFSHLFISIFTIPSQFFFSFNKGYSEFFFDLVLNPGSGLFDSLDKYFEIFNFFVFYGWGTTVFEFFFTGFFYSLNSYLVDEIFFDNLNVFVMLIYRGFDGFDELFGAYGYFFFFFSMIINFFYRIFFNFFNFFVFFDVNFLVLFDSSFFCFFFSFFLFFFFLKNVFFLLIFNLNFFFFYYYYIFLRFFFLEMFFILTFIFLIWIIFFF